MQRAFYKKTIFRLSTCKFNKELMSTAEAITFLGLWLKNQLYN
jgi:hypothetical protein